MSAVYKAMGTSAPKEGTPQRVNLVALPTTDLATTIGESGVDGFAAAGLLQVAILEEGRPSNEPPEKRELERIKKAISRDSSDVVAQLKEAAFKHRHVRL